MPFASRSRRRDASSSDDSRDDSEDRGRPRTRHFKPSVPMNPPEEITPIMCPNRKVKLFVLIPAHMNHLMFDSNPTSRTYVNKKYKHIKT